MTRSEVLIRARKAIGHGCIYGLGKGGMKPNAGFPWDDEKHCDCSGFVAWCLGVSRKTDSPLYVPYLGHWLETTAVVRDAVSPFGMFEKVEWALAEIGDVLVYGDHGGGQGHIGIVSQVEEMAGPTDVIHCSKGESVRHGDAIAETSVGIFRQHGAIAARCALVTDELA